MAGVGLELMFNSVRSQIRGREDAIVCFIHWSLVSNGYKCIGTGENIPVGADVTPSEMLPDGWNSSSDVFTLLYYPENNNNITMLLKVVRMDSSLLLHLAKLQDDSMGQTSIETDKYATGSNTFKSAYNNLDGLKRVIETELLGSLKTQQNTQPSNSQTTREDQTRRPPDGEDPLRIGPSRQPGGIRAPPEWADPGDPFSIGRSDLDPLASGARGGGMIFDPMHSGYPGRGGFHDPSTGMPGQLPRSIPPGARFDPFGPPDLDRSGNPRRGGPRAGPDPDHLPPPGYDDMFM